ncbi:ABC transporter thiamine pyrophosphate-binding lipoprotein p37/Cypl [Mycoplasmopsis edwardii]|uniref:DNA repair protein n=1 Tax=Mycoplasmopsis edwardii TaxID=53558 RepID=A0ACD4PHK6_9BACT|nr:DNA repair protein [Mycoplasmopsis edwardii]WBP84152.1 DNA repair protein [Mycoplasmopsis edwardii]
MKKIFNKLLLTTGLVSVPLIVSSCSEQKQNQGNVSEAKLIRIKLNNSLNSQDPKAIEFESKVNELIKAKGFNFDVKFSFEGEDNYKVNFDDILKEKQDVVFVSAGQVFSNQKEIVANNISVGIQTRGLSFKGSKNSNNEVYKDGLENDPLREIAKAQLELFNRIPRSNWNDKENGNNWDGSVYRSFFNEGTTPYQRGLIVVVANEEDTNNIIKAWNEKDLEKFVSYGIGIGSSSSGSKYLLPQALMKKHFGDKFTSFLNLVRNHSDKVSKAAWKNMNEESNINKKIFFDNEGVYTWTKYKDNDKLSVDESKRANQKVSFLTVTDVLPYNVGLFSNKISKKQIKVLSEVLNELATQKQDPWGPHSGFHGYSFIENENDQFWNIVKKSFE